MTNDVGILFIYLFAFHIIFGEMSIWLFTHFLIGLFDFFCYWLCEFFIYFSY